MVHSDLVTLEKLNKLGLKYIEINQNITYKSLDFKKNKNITKSVFIS